mgnify:CR=1 FL=1
MPGSFSAVCRSLNATSLKDCRLPIAIEQKVSTRNPRSTVGTASEIYDYLRLLFARIGKTFSPVSGNLVKKNTVDDVVECMKNYADGTRIAIVAPIVLPSGRTIEEQLDIYKKEGFSRIERNGEFLQIDDAKDCDTNCNLLIDRLTVSSDADTISRLTDSVETAFYEGDGQCRLLAWTPDGIAAAAFSNDSRRTASSLSSQPTAVQLQQPLRRMPHLRGIRTCARH